MQHVTNMVKFIWFNIISFTIQHGNSASMLGKLPADRSLIIWIIVRPSTIGVIHLSFM